MLEASAVEQIPGELPIYCSELGLGLKHTPVHTDIFVFAGLSNEIAEFLTTLLGIFLRQHRSHQDGTRVDHRIEGD